MLIVERGVRCGQLGGERLVVGARAFAPRRAARPVDGKRNDALSRQSPVGARPTLDEHDDGSEHILRRSEVTAVRAQLAAAEAHHHVAIAREPASFDSREAQAPQANEQFIRVARRNGVGVERQHELRLVPATEHRLQRAKHFTGPATNVDSLADQTSVDTSISVALIRMLFTDEGRPPRERLLIVPDVEMIVPRFVCSM